MHRDKSQKENQSDAPDPVYDHRPLSLVPLVDFLSKVEEDCVRKVLSVTRDEFL